MAIYVTCEALTFLRDLPVAVIRHTFQSTNLNQLMIGAPVNLEVDILGKYFERFFYLGRGKDENDGSKLTFDYLKSQGF